MDERVESEGARADWEAWIGFPVVCLNPAVLILKLQSSTFGFCSLMISVGNMDWTVRGWSLHSSASSVKSKRKRVSDLLSLWLSHFLLTSPFITKCVFLTAVTHSQLQAVKVGTETYQSGQCESQHTSPSVQVHSVTSAVLFFLKGFYCSLFNHKYIMKFCDDAQYHKIVGVCIVSCALVSTASFHSFHLGFVCIKTVCN